MLRRVLGRFCFACLLLGGGPGLALAQTGPRVDFARDVLPVLAGKCFACHGPDKGAGKAGVRLHARDLALRPAKSGAVPIKPGRPADSEIVRRIGSDDDAERMPPPGKKPLSAGEQETIRRWIAEGAEYRLPWAFVKPVRPAPPKVAHPAWVKNDVDAFVLARLEHAGLRPSAPADRPTLIRRLSLDLRGLPPSLAEVDEYLADTAFDATAKLVDRMLASPHYGEKMAQLWLDLARGGDTSGYNQDSVRQVWLWRDGVIDAFNRNQRFDQFTIEQLAGDLLPDATVAQKIASGFNRNTRFNEEDGACPDEFYSRGDADRTNTLGQVWLGLTLGCAECHDHKYDPISQKEYYQLFAFFTGIKEPPSGFLHDRPLPPILRLPSPEHAAALKKEHASLALIEATVAGELKRIAYTDPLAGQPDQAADPERADKSQLAWELQAEGDIKLPIDLREALTVAPDKRSAGQKDILRSYYLRKIHAGTRDVFQELDHELEQVKKEVRRLESIIPYAMISEELVQPRPAHVLVRGDFQQKGEPVGRAVPAVLPPLPAEAPRNRLGLAQWLVHPDHPLTARVTVNRLWAQMFGTGLVRPLGDFGSQGEPPSHPELLDWLAVEFVRNGWDVKALLKTIALSNTYRQASGYRQEKSDPDNRLLYRAPRFRLSAEEVRDSALAIAGLMSPKVGGPPMMPYQPAGFYVGKFEGWPWRTSAGPEQHRRGLYTFWRRSALHPMFAIFDAPTREECTVARPRTNTPLQALVTLNDPTFVEAARVFAQRILADGPEDRDGRLTFAFRIAVARPPSGAELGVLRRRLEEQRKRYAADRRGALQLVSVGDSARPANLDVVEHAAWTTVASMLLNLDEVMMRE